MGAVASPESCAKKGDGEGALEYLSKAGKWALGKAEKIGVPVAMEAFKVSHNYEERRFIANNKGVGCTLIKLYKCFKK